MYGIEINLCGSWKPVNPPAGPPPYSFASEAEARTMARILYPAIANDPERLRIGELGVPFGWGRVEAADGVE